MYRPDQLRYHELVIPILWMSQETSSPRVNFLFGPAAARKAASFVSNLGYWLQQC
jgi:hypothetical protein